LEEADETLSKRDWRAAREMADAALEFDPDNDEAGASFERRNARWKNRTEQS